MKLINVEPKDNYILRVYLDDDSIIDFDVKPELERIPCYKPLYNKELFNTVKFKNKRIYWNEQFDFHLDQIIEAGQSVQEEINQKTKLPLFEQLRLITDYSNNDIDLLFKREKETPSV